MAFFDDINDEAPKTGWSSKENSNREKEKETVKDMPPHQDSDLGEAPDYPAIYFVYNYETQKLEVRDRRGKIKQEIPILTINGTNGESAYTLWLKDHQGSIVDFMESLKGANGKNGKNAYEEWKEWQGPDADVSPEAYWNYFKGENGKSAFELWKEVHGEKVGSTPDDFFEYLKGQNGKDAFEVWQDLGYKNSTREDFFKWIASLVKTQKGEDGKVFYPHFDGFTIYFTEDLEGKGTHIAEKDIRGKDGRTFEPVFNGTELHFDDKEGHKTDPVDLRGKDAFELWKEYHHKPDAKYEEFEEYFKGQNVTAKHSYLDIKDVTCPVQTIDTDLIANVLDSGASPDNLIKLRQEDIDKLRNEGNKRNDVYITTKKLKIKIPYFFLNGSRIFKNWAGWFKEFSWWCAGADRGLLRMCPGDHSKYTGIGTVILFTALMAWFSSYMAMRLVFQVPEDVSLLTLTGGNLGAIAFATFWALLIFFLDRFITNTMYSDGKVTISKEEIIGGLPRILISIFLGIVISAPLELRIFSDEIENYWKTKLLDQYKTQVIDNSKLLSFANNQVEQAREDYDLARQNFEYFQALKADTTYKNYYGTKRITTSQTNGTKTTVTHGNGISTESYGGGSSTYITIPDYNKKKLDLWKEDSINAKRALDKAEEAFQQSKDTLLSVEQSLKNSYDFDSAYEKIGLYDRLEAMHKIALNSEKPNEFKPLALMNPIRIACSIIIFILFILIICLKTIEWNKIKRLLAMVTALIIGGLTFSCFNLLYELGYFLFTPIGLIMLLFILIDISPVLYKMMLADGVYDNYLHQEKLLAQDKIRLSLARMLRNIEKGELKSLSPFIMGKMYRKLMKFSTSKDGLYNGQDKDYKQHIQWENAGGLNDDIKKTNKEVFDVVLDYKKRIILASYAAWYRDMRDAMIGKKDDEEGSKITPDAHLYENDTQQEHTDKNEDAKTDSNTQQNDEANDGSESSSQDNSSDEK